LIQALKSGGAQVDVEEIAAGHELTSQDLQRASQWLASAVSSHFAH
jgi:predicted esterase